MLYNVVKSISEKFIKEASSSPQLLSDMAAMEKYMSESYNGRIFVELLQNADDCNSKRILVKQIGNDLLFANDGHPFTEKDVIAISRSGASSKERGESIGYRGIGFKSTTYLTDEIIIHSDDTNFSFSKSLMAFRHTFSEIKLLNFCRGKARVNLIWDFIRYIRQRFWG